MTLVNFTPDNVVSSDDLDSNFAGIANGSEMGYNTEWLIYNPIWASDGTQPSIGAGTLQGRYIKVGRLIIGRIHFKFGAGTSFGTGQIYFSLPEANSTVDYPTNHHYIGECYMEDFGTTGYQGKAYILSTRQNYVYVTAITANTTYSQNAGCTVSIPFTWSTNDYMTIEFMYEAAE